MKKTCIVGQWTTKHAGLILMVALLSVFVIGGCESTSHGQQGELPGGVIGGVDGSWLVQ